MPTNIEALVAAVRRALRADPLLTSGELKEMLGLPVNPSFLGLVISTMEDVERANNGKKIRWRMKA